MHVFLKGLKERFIGIKIKVLNRYVKKLLCCGIPVSIRPLFYLFIAFFHKVHQLVRGQIRQLSFALKLAFP